jgi:hypothetical protein
MPQASVVWLVRAVVLTTFLLLVLVSGPRARASEIRQIDAAWIPVADGRAQPNVAGGAFRQRSITATAIPAVLQ